MDSEARFHLRGLRIGTLLRRAHRQRQGRTVVSLEPITDANRAVVLALRVTPEH